ncbi:hypothetical protein U1Q18_014284 [Sarracenia purpurea var. burkii]
MLVFLVGGNWSGALDQGMVCCRGVLERGLVLEQVLHSSWIAVWSSFGAMMSCNGVWQFSGVLSIGSNMRQHLAKIWPRCGVEFCSGAFGARSGYYRGVLEQWSGFGARLECDAAFGQDLAHMVRSASGFAVVFCNCSGFARTSALVLINCTDLASLGLLNEGEELNNNGELIPKDITQVLF